MDEGGKGEGEEGGDGALHPPRALPQRVLYYTAAAMISSAITPQLLHRECYVCGIYNRMRLYRRECYYTAAAMIYYTAAIMISFYLLLCHHAKVQYCCFGSSLHIGRLIYKQPFFSLCRALHAVIIFTRVSINVLH